MSNMDLQNLHAELPCLSEKIARIADKTVLAHSPLSVCFVGEFSTGKSSLINSLLGESLLPTASEEATALPTFIEYADQVQRELLDVQGGRTAISAEAFVQYTTEAPENSFCSRLLYPAEWLRELILVDLPGLGSTSQRHRAYTNAQISASDVIVYLLSSRGVTQGDLDLLRVVKENRKKVMVVVGKWDGIESSIKEGEQAPDLCDWGTTLLQKTGLDLDLVGVSKYGHGHDKIVRFLAQSKAEVAAIRERRFQAELSPILQNRLVELETEKQVLGAATAEQKKSLQEALLSERAGLLELKQSVYEKSNLDQAQLKKSTSSVVEKEKTELLQALQALPAIEQEKDWPIFLEAAYQQLQHRLKTLATELESSSNQYGDMGALMGDVKKIDLHLPTPEKICFSDFLDSGRLEQLHEECRVKQAKVEDEKQNIEQIPDVDLDAACQDVQMLQMEQHTVAQQELPRVLQQVEGSNAAGKVGKAVGTLLDIGLIFLAPPTAATKGAAVVGAGAKALKTAKVVGGALKKVKETASTLDPVINFTEKLSLSYWGERIGNSFDAAPRSREVVDPEAEAEQRRVLNEYTQKISEKRRELMRLEQLRQQRDYSEFALEEHLKQQQQLERKIKQLESAAVNAEREAKAEAEQQRKQVQKNYRQQVVDQNVNSLGQQARSMTQLIAQHCKSYWQEEIKVVLQDKIDSIDSLAEKIQMAPQHQQEQLLLLQNRVEGVQKVIASLEG
ncbi:MAG: dynamin family protein [Gammaproteobacteria bacterium]|nr:dynamin family protein [Gammaproteobacteria bacterium]